MWPISQVFLDALRYSHVMTATLDVFNVDNFGVPTRVLRDVPIVDGSVTVSRKSKVRRTLSAELILEYPNDGYTNLINSTNCQVQVWKGIEFAGATERVPLGVFRLDSVSQENKGALSISGQSLEIYVIEDRFIAPYQPLYGRPATLEIASLIQASTHNAPVINKATNDYRIQKRTPWPRERWDAVDDLAEAIVADVYCGADGTFIIADQPDLIYSPVQWVFDEGDRGVLVTLSKTQERTGVYNAVVASGQSNDTNIPAVSAAAYDLDPSSPTYWDGGFGHVPKFYSSQFLYTAAQCLAVAQGQLAESRGLNKTLVFSGVPNPALEAGDAVMVAMLDGSFEKHILQGFSVPLGDGDWTADTVATDTSATGDSEDSSGTSDLAQPMMASLLSQNTITRANAARLTRLP